MKRFIEAEDPENGIEDEYHPKHEEVYCWRARRLMSKKKIRYKHMSIFLCHTLVFLSIWLMEILHKD